MKLWIESTLGLGSGSGLGFLACNSPPGDGKLTSHPILKIRPAAQPQPLTPSRFATTLPKQQPGADSEFCQRGSAFFLQIHALMQSFSERICMRLPIPLVFFLIKINSTYPFFSLLFVRISLKIVINLLGGRHILTLVFTKQVTNHMTTNRKWRGVLSMRSHLNPPLITYPMWEP